MVDVWNVIRNDAKSKGIKFAQPTFTSNVMGFYHAVNWQERWIQCILLFHVFVITLVIVTRNNSNIHSLLLAAICVTVYFAETFNTYGAENWETFSTQDYFDKNGVFVTVVFSAPLVFTGFSMTLYTMYKSSQLLIKVKRKELGVDKKDRKKKKTELGKKKKGGGGDNKPKSD